MPVTALGSKAARLMFDEAITYAERHTLHALVIARDGKTVVERTAAGRPIAQPHALYSGTKSFWGLTALAAHEDNLLELDEPLGWTITEWPAASARAGVTIRQLLSLTAGYGFGGLGNAVPTGSRALDIPLKTEPGTVFTYSGIPLQVFGEVLRRKLAPRFACAVDYLAARVLDPIGMAVADWRRLADGTRPLPTGAFVAAHEWLKFASLLLARGAGVISPASFAACTTGSALNPKYGLGLWLADGAGPDGAFYASGAGGQALYVLPRRRIVAVHFGQSSSWNHAAFIKRLDAS
jgi:CubicO group peptidase (beta-lactamase class C family)